MTRMSDVSRFNHEQAELESIAIRSTREALEQFRLPEVSGPADVSDFPAGCSTEIASDRCVSVTHVADDPYADREFDGKLLTKAVLGILEEAGLPKAEISIALVNDAKIHSLNRQFLNHDYPTDVITFPIGEENGCFHGEIVVSVDTAKATAARLGWPASHELLLYVIHGALHLVGYDDQDPESITAMRLAERRHLARFGLAPPEEPSEATNSIDS